jgi:hypothetical protein
VMTMEFFVLPFATHDLHIKHQTRVPVQKISASSARVKNNNVREAEVQSCSNINC